MKKLVMIVTLVPVLLAAKWIKTFDHGGTETGRYVLELDNGSFVVLGEVVFEDSTSLFLDKFDPDGNLVWSRLHEGSRAWMVIHTTDGGFAIAGVTNYPYPEPTSIIIIKTDHYGEKKWIREYLDDDDLTIVRGCIRQEDDGYTIVGDAFIRTDTLGDTLYTRTYHEYYPYVFQRSNLTDDGGYFLCGYALIISQPRHSNTWDGDCLVKLDLDGNVTWVDSSFQGIGSDIHLSQGHEGFVYIGDIWYWDSTMYPDFNMRIAEWSYEYGKLWEQEIGEDTIDEYGNYISRTSNDCYIATGTPLTLIKLSAWGDVLWTREIAGEGHFVQELSDGGFVVTGTLDDDLLLIKTDSLGYVSVIEDPIDHHSSIDLISPIGPEVVLRYSNLTESATFNVVFYDVLGRKVDEVHLNQTSGSLTWPLTHQSPGVYFIRPVAGNSQTIKVIITR